MSPFYAVYGRHPPPISLLPAESSSHLAAHDILQQRQTILKDLHTNLHAAQNYMTQKANRHRRDTQFVEGDQVVVKLQPYRQTSLTTHKFSKLQRKFFGHFTIIKKIGNVAYKLDLPSSARIHPVFHVSRLKAFHSAAPSPIATLPVGNSDGLLLVQPADILGSQWVLRHGTPTQQLLVQWDTLPVSDASWIDLPTFRRDYPHYNLEGKVDLQRGSDDTGMLTYKRRHK